MWGFQGAERGGGVSLAWRRLGLLGRKRRRRRVGGFTGLGSGALRAGFAGLDALVAEEPSDGSEVRHEDDDGIEQGLCDASVRQAELGIPDAGKPPSLIPGAPPPAGAASVLASDLRGPVPQPLPAVGYLALTRGPWRYTTVPGLVEIA